MAEVTGLRHNALPYPVYGAPWGVVFPMLDADGDLVTGATTPDAERSLNGDTFADCTNESTEIATNSGMYYLLLTAAEMTADVVTVIAKSATAGMKTTPIVLYPRKLVTLRSGTSASGGSLTASIVLDASASAIDDFYNGCLCVATLDGTVEARVISDYTGSTQTATVVPDWNIAPDNNDTFVIYVPDGGMQIRQANTTLIAGAAVSTSSAQIGVNVVNAGATAWASGAITSGVFASGAITATAIASDAITAAKVADGTIDAATFAAGAINATAIASDAITAAKVADGTIDAATFAAGAINASAIASDAITAAKVADGAIDAATFATGAITAAAIAADAITDAKVASDVTIASVTGSVGSVSGAVGSVTGNVGGNVTGSVGSVVGAVGSVAGNVGGNVTGSVGSVASGGITSSSFGSSAITATAIASDAITAAKVADGAIDAATFATGAIDASAIATDAITAAKVASDAIAEIQSAIPTANENADALLDRASAVEGTLTVRKALRLMCSVIAGKLSGGGTTTNTFRDAVADSKDRVTATVDSSGNRTDITYDLT